MNGTSLHVGFDEVRRNWGWFLVLGIALIVLGTFALAWSALTTFASVFLFGWLLLVTGAMEVVSAVWTRRWTGFFLHLLAGVLDGIIGLLIVTHPVTGELALTLLLAAFFMVGGLYRLITALMLQFPNWGWAALGGAITLVLGIVLWRSWPESALWFIGLCVGIELLFRGWAWVMLALAIRTAVPGPAPYPTGREEGQPPA
jgi:uncharacterized membrane protein HdeD (DUF308 family)